MKTISFREDMIDLILAGKKTPTLKPIEPQPERVGVQPSEYQEVLPRILQGAAMNPLVLDACCGPRKFWFDKQDGRALFVDNRREQHTVSDQSSPGGLRQINVSPDVVADFRALPFADESFALVVFDPPHLLESRTGKRSFMFANYGALNDTTWQQDLKAGFAECFRVLKPEGVLIFKWAETNIQLAKILPLTPHKPLFGNKMPKSAGTHWVVFMKG